MNLGSADELNRALARTAETRPEKIEEAKKLIQDASYPPEVLVRKLSALLAIHSVREGSSE